MKMTFDEYIQNPAGKANAVYSNRDVYRSLYRGKLNNVILRENGKFDLTLYKGTDRHVIHLKVPSEPIPKFYYDTVVEFKNNGSKKLNTMEVRFYSNDPSFCYTFAYVFNKHKLFIDELKSVMPNDFLKVKAEEKNPQNIVGYVKSLYFAYLYMSDKGLFDDSMWSTAQKLDYKKLAKDIMPADQKIQARQEAQNDIDKKSRVAKAKASNTRETPSERTSNSGRLTPLVRTTKTVGTVGKTKKSTIIKPSRRSR
jgi:hypothetical protein